MSQMPGQGQGRGAACNVDLQRFDERSSKMQLGVQFSASVAANSTQSWFTHSWPAEWHVVWMVVPTGPVQNSAAQLEWKVEVERQTAEFVKYFIEVKNLTGGVVNFDARYAVLS